jgi:hypothetical protein
MDLRSRTVERMLASNFGIQEDRLLAFRGRLDHLRRQGCPSGVNTGKGKAAVYDWAQIVELALALSLLDLGISPEHASAFVKRNAQSIHLAICDLLGEGRGRGELPLLAERQEWPIETTTFLIGTAFALAGLTPKGNSEPPGAAFVKADSVADWFGSTHDVARTIFLIDLGTKLVSLMGLVAIWSESPVEQVVSDIEAWADALLEKLIESAS